MCRDKRWAFILSVCIVALLHISPHSFVFAQGSSLELTKSIENALTEVDSGQAFVYVLRYRCVGITSNCLNASVTDILPPELSYAAADVQMFGTIHTTSTNYNPATGTATWTFVNPLLGGSTGELRLVVRFPPGITPDGTIATNQATISDTSSNPNVVPSNPVTIVARAQNRLTVNKVLVSGGSLDTNTVYRIDLCRPVGSINGQLNMTGITMTDPLPTGATFVSTDGGGVYNPVTQTITWTLPDYDVTTSPRCISRTVTVRYDTANGFTAGTSVTNPVSVTGTPVGQLPITLTGSVTHILTGPTPGTEFGKSADVTEALIGQLVRYGFLVRNTGSVPLDDYVITDVIPAAHNVTAIHTGQQASVALPMAIRYQTNLNAVYQAVPGSPFTSPQTIAVSALGLLPGEYITVLQWDYGDTQPLPVGFMGPFAINQRAGFTAAVLAVDRSGNPVNFGQVIINVGNLVFTHGGSTFTRSDDHRVTVIIPAARPIITKSVLSTTPINPEETIQYRLEVSNATGANFDLVNPVITDLLDDNVEFVSWSFDAFTSGSPPPTAPTPSFEQIDNYNGTGRTLLRWSWIGAEAYTFLPGEAVRLEYVVRSLPGTPPGVATIVNRGYVVAWDASVPQVTCLQPMTDSNDLNSNGSTADQICASNEVQVGVNSLAAMQSIKYARGDLDTDWRRFPESAIITTGGTVEYRLVMENVGNIGVTDLVIIDILPFVGDTGVIYTTPRNSIWRPTLVAPITPPPGVTVFYSTEGNPCRPEVVPGGPVGCSPPNWSTAPPADLTTVQALRFEACCAIPPLGSFELTWAMQAPLNILAGQSAWNSFAFVARRQDTGQVLLPTEPLSVGTTLAVQPLNGTKTLTYGTPPDITYRMVWLNSSNFAPVNARIFDVLPPGTSFVWGSILCETRGVSFTQRCLYDEPNNRILWEGIVGADPGSTSLEDSNNGVIISFMLNVSPFFQTITNQAGSVVDTDNDGDFDDEPPNVGNRPSNPITWERRVFEPARVITSDDLVLTKSVTPFNAMPGEIATWTIGLTNIGDVPALNVEISDEIAATMEILSVSSTSGTVTVNGQMITVRQLVLNPDQSIVVTAIVRVRNDVQPPIIINNTVTTEVGGRLLASSEANILRVTMLPSTGQSHWSVWRAQAVNTLLAAVVLALLRALILTAAGLRRAHNR